MKNRLLYSLISLMVVSLIGIISIQSIWISGAIETSKKTFATHVNDAMNKVNDAIDIDETKLIIDETYGGVDSLLHDIVFVDSTFTRHEIHQGNGDSQIVIKNRIKNSNDPNLSDFQHIEELTVDMKRMSEDIEDWEERIEVIMDAHDSSKSQTIHIQEFRESKKDHINSMVNRFSFEALLSGDLKSRISAKELNKKLKLALKKEGVDSKFKYAVYNRENDRFEDGFVSKGFNKKQKSELYKKDLFPSDQRKKSQYQLIIQVDDEGKYVWGEVKKMAILSGIFSVLILISFGYALYFIFKQKKISQIKNDFIDNMTHELKTPLASIALASASIKHPEIITKPDEIRKYTSIIDSEKNRINSHIERVLDIATLDKGDLKLNFTNTDFMDIIQSSLQNVRLSLNEINGKHSLKSTIDSAPLKADEFHMLNVITNILDNSIKYRADDLTIDIELEQKAHNYVLKIKDNGIGMTAKEQNLAFDKFYRAETGNIHNRKGFGLGLSYVKGIVEQHKGSVKIQSQSKIGTTVILTIPASNG